MPREERKKGIKGQRAKPPFPTLEIDAIIGNSEQNGKQKKKKNREQDPNPATLAAPKGYIAGGLGRRGTTGKHGKLGVKRK